MKLILGIIGLILIAKNVSGVYEVSTSGSHGSIKIIEHEKEGYFESVTFMKISVTVESELEYVDVYIDGITEKRKLTLYGNKTNYLIDLPLYIPDKGVVSGKYNLIVEGFGMKDSKKIKLKHRERVDGDFNIELNSMNDSEQMNLSLFNEGIGSMFEIWPKGFRASKTERVYISNSTVFEKHLIWDNTSDIEMYGLNLVNGRQKSSVFHVKVDEFVETEGSERHLVYESSSKKAGNLAIYLFCLALVLIILSIQKFK